MDLTSQFQTRGKMGLVLESHECFWSYKFSTEHVLSRSGTKLQKVREQK
jgi:hypothetical protein